MHTYAYNSFGRVDYYRDPKQREQKFLPDALGRVVEHVRIGDLGDVILNTAEFVDAGQADGRTKETRFDDNGNKTITHWDFAGRPFIVQNPGGDDVPTAATKNKSMCLYAEYDGASRLAALYDGDLGKTEFLRDGPGRVIQRKLVNSGNSTDRISQWNTQDWLRRDALGRIGHNEYLGSPANNVQMGTEAFEHDSLGRVNGTKFVNSFAPAHEMRVTSSWTGSNPFRAELEYGGLVNGQSSGMETAKMTYGRDAIGRLASIAWDRSPGSVGTMKPLAEYGWVGGLRRSRSVHYRHSTLTEGFSSFSYDGFGRLTQIKDDLRTVSNPVTMSQFDYAYDEASNLTKEKYAKVGGGVGDRFAYDAYHRLSEGWLGVDQTTMGATSNPGGFDPLHMHERLTYGLDGVNNRQSSSSQTGSSPAVTNYSVQGGAHWQGPSNRYNTVQIPGAPTAATMEYDERGNMTYDGRFAYRYDFMNRLQEVWRVIPNGDAAGDGEKFGVIEEGALEEAREDVKLEVPDLYSRLAREVGDPVFRARLKATISGGVLRITPTPQGGGGRPGFLPVNGTLVLAAVYVYDAFNRRTMSILLEDINEGRAHTWDGWRQCTEHLVEPNGSGTWVATPKKQFVWGSRLDELVAYRRSAAGGWESYYLLHGGQDTAAKLVNSAGAVVEQYEYDPYGRVKVFVGSSATAVAASAYGLPFLWKSVRLDEITGLLQMRHRYYSVEMGRFLTTDPIGTFGDVANAGNSYGFVGNSPMVASDPFGLHSQFDTQNPAPTGSQNSTTPQWVKDRADAYNVPDSVRPQYTKCMTTLARAIDEWGRAHAKRQKAEKDMKEFNDNGSAKALKALSGLGGASEYHYWW